MSTLTFPDGEIATFHLMKDGPGPSALYAFPERGKIHVQPAFDGCPERHAVTISLGAPGDRSGYTLTGLQVGVYLLTGVVVCTGPNFRVGRHVEFPERFPEALASLGDADPDAYAEATALLGQIAAHFHSVVSGL